MPTITGPENVNRICVARLRYLLRLILFLGLFIVPWLGAVSARAQANGPGYDLFLTNTTISVPGFGTNMPTNEITIEFWQRLTNNPGSGSWIIPFEMNPDNSGDACHAYVPYLDGKIYWAFGSTADELSYTPAISLAGSWQHFAFVASVSSNYMAIYRNGILEAHKSGVTPFIQNNWPMVFGSRTANQDWDEVRIWNVARTATQIQQNMNRSLVGNEPGLVAYWRYDEGAGTTAYDSTGNGFTGHILNADWHVSTAPIVVPGASTLTPNGLMDTFAAVHGVAMSSGADTECWFNYGTNTAYGSTTAPFFISGTNLLPVYVTNLITGLTPGMHYHYQLMATNEYGTNAGLDFNFTTLLPGASFVRQTTADLACSIKSELYENISLWFQYGTTTNYGTVLPSQFIIGTNAFFDPPFVSKNLSGLIPATTYHFQIVVTNSLGTNYGEDISFTTLSNSITTLSSLATGPGTGPLSPAFASGTTSYNAAVSNGMNTVTVIPTATDSNATIQVSVNGGSFAPVVSGSSSAPLPVSVGQNSIDIRVTAQNLVNTQDYFLNAYVDTNNIWVTTTAPKGPGSLNAAISDADIFGTPHVINLASNTVYAYSNADNFWYGPNALPPITANITINGNGATLERATTNGLRFFYVGADPNNPATANYNTPGAGILTLRQVTLSGGLCAGGAGGGGGAGMGGAIFNQGILVLDSATLANNTALGGAASGYGFYSTGPAGGGLGGNGFGGTVYPAGSTGGGISNLGGGGGGGFIASDNGAVSAGEFVTNGFGGQGGGLADGLGGYGGGCWGSGSNPGGGGYPGHGSGGGGGGFLENGSGNGGNFGMTGATAFNFGGGGGGGGVGSGGGGGLYSPAGSIGDGFGGGGGGGFGGGGGSGGEVYMEQVGAGYETDCAGAGNGGFGGGGGGYANGSTGGAIGGFGGGSCTANIGDGGGGGAGMGGAIFNHGGFVMTTNCTLSGNRALGGPGGSLYYANGGCGYGGAIFNLNGTVNISSSTLAGNTVAPNGQATAGGAAVYNLAYDSTTAQNATITLANSILGGNSGGADLVNNQPSATVVGTNVSSATCIGIEPSIVQSVSYTGGNTNVTGIIVTNPLVGPLANNGGPTPTMALLPGSPAVNSGDATIAPATDQRGASRLTGGNLDLGAVQFQAGSTPSFLTSYGFATPGSFQIQFTGNTGAGYTVWTTTNLSLPFPNWTELGAATQISNGVFQFVDTSSSNASVRFYRVSQP